MGLSHFLPLFHLSESFLLFSLMPFSYAPWLVSFALLPSDHDSHGFLRKRGPFTLGSDFSMILHT